MTRFENPVQIKLREKYRSASNGRYKGGERAAPLKKRSKTGYELHVKKFGVPPKMTKVVSGRGKSHMERVP